NSASPRNTAPSGLATSRPNGRPAAKVATRRRDDVVTASTSRARSRLQPSPHLPGLDHDVVTRRSRGDQHFDRPDQGLIKARSPGPTRRSHSQGFARPPAGNDSYTTQ